MAKHKVQDFILHRPILDQAVPLVLLVAWYYLCKQLIPGSDSDISSVYVGLSAMAGIVLAAATFVCTMLYQSQSSSAKALRARFSKTMAKNWASIFSFVFVAAILPLVATLVRDSDPRLAFALVIYSAGILIGRSFRTYLWLIVLFKLEAAPEPPSHSGSTTQLKPHSG